MSLLPVAVWGLTVSTEDGIVSAIPAIPAIFRITMAALDPTAKPKDATQPKRATLKLMRRRLQNYGFDNDESEESEDGESEDEGPAKKVTGKKGSRKDGASAKKGKAEDKMEIEGDDDDEDDDDEDEDDDDDDDEDDGKGNEIEEFTICTLDSERHYQQTLDITIGEEEECFFKVIGNYDISLTGNYVVPSNGGHGDNDESESESEDYDLSPSEDELNMYGEESESDDLDDLEDPRIQEIATDEEAVVKRTKAKFDKAVKKSLKRAADELEHEDLNLDELIAKSKEVKEAAAAPEKKLSKKQLKKLKANDGKAIDATADAKAKKVQFAKELEQGPTPSPAVDKKPKEQKTKEQKTKEQKTKEQTTKEQKTKEQTTKEQKTKEQKTKEQTTKEQKKLEVKKPEAAGKLSKVVQGVTIMDSKVGTGPAAKIGNRLSMRYIGKLENGKIFDSNTKGKPFTFSLGKGEVIKGWDLGLEGMQVGGERRLRIPPVAAYGKRAIPDIPANSTLIFDVKLIEIK